MTRKIQRLIAIMAALWVTGAQAEPLPGSEWQPVALNDESFEPLAEAFLRFDQDGRYFGNGGCNAFRGFFVTNGRAILFSPAASTRMLCPEPISQQESALLRALDTVRGFDRTGRTLTLYDETSAEVLVFRQRDPD